MKVIHILVELKFSGAEIMYVDAAPEFQDLGCQLTVMATAKNRGDYAPFFEKAKYKVLHWPFPKWYNILGRFIFYKNFLKLIKKEGYDVVHIHSLNFLWGIALCSWLANVKSVFTFHNVYSTHFFSYPYHCFVRWSVKKIFKCKLQSISESVYSHELSLYHNNTYKIFNWYGSNRFYPADEEEKAKNRQLLGIMPNDFVIISIGGCSNIKRHSEIIKALKIVLEFVPNCIYLHLGKGDTESQEMQLAKELGIINNIRFCGNQSDVRKYLIVSNLYIMPSLFEGISITTIEAMACVVPTILYNVPGLKDFNRDEINSILIPEDYRILANKILYVYNNRLEANEMALKAKKFVNQNFDMKSNVTKIFNLYK